MTDIGPSSVPIQQESVQFNQPVSESAATAIGGAVNYSLLHLPPVGTVIDSMLTQSQMNSNYNTGPATIWQLCDGSSVVGSAFTTITGLTNVPDMRGVYSRCPDLGRGLDPNGNQSNGTFIGDQFDSHDHLMSNVAKLQGVAFTTDTSGTPVVINFGSVPQTELTGGSETAPKTVYLTKFIRIN